ncbi:MAG TPA: dihydroorotate dehydrogenase electron transfer subunit [Euryarchaeota archaeon]|nr:dihydroorotate dehydrogenase electron transfer subunit [Euryarchaeota archaeon]
MTDNPGYLVSKVLSKEEVAHRCFKIGFDSILKFQPGQFVMIWLPDIDEIPMSISHSGPDFTGITVKIVGEATEALGSVSKGDRIRVRGPYGKGFEPSGERPLLVAGGIGAAPLLPLAKQLAGRKSKIRAIIGARTQNELVLTDEFSDLGAETEISTDDGSAGFHGTAAELCRETVGKLEFDSIYCCGPEPMIVTIVEIAQRNGIWGQASVEKMMKCGIGICGSCAISDRLVCRDGPIFDLAHLDELHSMNKIF